MVQQTSASTSALCPGFAQPYALEFAGFDLILMPKAA
jgi:hypothetical protein